MRAEGVIGIAFAVALSYGCTLLRHDSIDTRCPATPKTLRLPSIAPAIGSSPVWMTGDSLGCWCGEHPYKAAWIVERGHSGSLIVRGQDLFGAGRVTFPGQPDDRNSVFEVDDATSRSSAIPGSATKDELDRFAFHNGYVAYSHPGCYRLIATLGDQVVNMVVAQARCPACTEPSADTSHRR